MLHLADSARSKARVNLLKKVKVNGQWKFCPAVVESNGRLRDKVRTAGQVETHSEGVYYVEWRENGHRRRAAIPHRSQVLERARLKALEIDARRAGIEVEIPEKPSPISSRGKKCLSVFISVWPWICDEIFAASAQTYAICEGTCSNISHLYSSIL